MKLKKKANGVYFIDVEVPDGEGGVKRARISLETKDQPEAEKQLLAWKLGNHPKHPNNGLNAHHKGSRYASVRQTPSSNGMTMRKLFDMCLEDREVWKLVRSQNTLRSNIKILNEHFGDLHPREVTEDRIRELADYWHEEGYAPATVKRKMETLKRALSAAVKRYKEDGERLIPFRPEFPTIDVENTRDRILEYHEEEVVFACIDARMRKQPNRNWWHFKIFLRVLLDTAFRRSEAMRLGPDNVRIDSDSMGNPVHVLSLQRYTTKNKKPREVPATDAIVEALPALNAQAVDGRWFHLDSTAWYMWNTIREDCKAHGVEIGDVWLHTMRHTCLTRLHRAGMELARLSKWAGHSDVSITAKRYVQVRATDMVDGLAVLNANPAKSSHPTTSVNLN